MNGKKFSGVQLSRRLVSIPSQPVRPEDIPVVDVFGKAAAVPITNAALLKRISDVAAKTQPDRIVFVQGTPEEDAELKRQMVEAGILAPLDSKKYPRSYIHRSQPSDTARVVEKTFTCTTRVEDAWPPEYRKHSAQAHAEIDQLLDGSMRGRTMYVVAAVLGPDASPHAQVGVQITDSPYVVANITALYGVGKAAFDRLNRPDIGDRYFFGINATANLDFKQLLVCRFPEERLTVSINSAYGGNAIHPKKLWGLGLGGAIALEEGWMAEHMALIELENPAGERMGVAICKPSASGKTNDAMLQAELTKLGQQGWKVRTISDDIVYMYVDEEGYLRAIPTERGFFGVAPGTSLHTNPNAMAAMHQDAIFTNVAMAMDGSVWWEGLSDPPDKFVDWRGRRWERTLPDTWKIGEGGARVRWSRGSWEIVSGRERPDPSEQKSEKVFAAHPNARYTARADLCPSISPDWQDPEGIRVGAIVFEGRRRDTVPLVNEAFDWKHGTFIGATLGAETTAAIAGEVGRIRRDPMAGGDFLIYPPAQYFQHWLRMGSRLTHPPKIFHKNSFGKDSKGKFVWPGYAENLRIYAWIFERAMGRGNAVSTPIGLMPTPADIDMTGLALLTAEQRKILFDVDLDRWAEEVAAMRTWLTVVVVRGGAPAVPQELIEELDALDARISAQMMATRFPDGHEPANID